MLSCVKDDVPYIDDTQPYTKVAAKAGSGEGPISDTPPRPRLHFPDSPVTELAPFGKIVGHTTTAYKDNLWVILGSDIWYSANGTNWTKYATPPFNAHGHTTVVFRNKLWVINGSGTKGNVIWNLDLNNRKQGWTRVAKRAPFSTRRDHQTVVYDGKLWVIGGIAPDHSMKKDVWYSSDGIRWTKATGNAPFGSRWGHTVTVFENKIWVIGGTIGGIPGDVWHSNDGITWVHSSNPFISRIHHESAVFNNKLWVIGGLETSLSSYVWYMGRNYPISPLRWTNITASRDINFHQRTSHTVTAFNSKLWIIGGHEVVEEHLGSELKGDVWAIEMR